MLLYYLRNYTKFRDTSYQFRGYRLSILEIPIINFENTVYRFRKYRRRYIFKDLGKIEGEIEDSKRMGDLKNMSKFRIKDKTEMQNFYTIPLTGDKEIDKNKCTDRSIEEQLSYESVKIWEQKYEIKCNISVQVPL